MLVTLQEKLNRYRELSSDSNPNPPLTRIGGYLDGYDKGRADAIEEYKREMIDFITGDEEFVDWQKREMLELNEIVSEQLKEQNRCEK